MKTEFSVTDGFLYLKAEYLPGETAFTPPASDSIASRREYDNILEHCSARGIWPKFCCVSEKTLEGLLKIFPDADYFSNESWSDYLYNSEDIVSLAGRRFSGQRNHINKFTREYPDWIFESVGENNLTEVRDYFERYSAEHIKDYPAYNEGNVKTLEIIDNYSRYGLAGGVLKVGGAIAGASFGETVGDTLYVHIEKANTDFAGSYPMLVNSFAKLAVNEKIRFINREEDDGVEGLRTSKLSYHPVQLLKKYIVEPKEGTK